MTNKKTAAYNGHTKFGGNSRVKFIENSQQHTGDRSAVQNTLHFITELLPNN
ncbi:MAG: hypothetical protein IIA88_06025 [Bacteroidetes bacterium]|nr:hypothetical protein [Bacteroidota bacterium]